MKLFSKKLGAHYLVEVSSDTEFYYIQLYKKWHKGEIYEATDCIVKINIKDKDKMFSIYNSINLKSMYGYFKRGDNID